MNIFIDTNIYLRFYHFSSEDLEELKKIERLIDAGKVKLYITPQIKREFNRNRENKIQDAIKKLTEFKFSISIPKLCTGYGEVEEIQKALRAASKKHSELLAKLNVAINKQELMADKVTNSLFEKAIEIPETRKLLVKAKWRKILGEPPGKKDSYGDQLNWESLLAASFGFENLTIIAADSDYASVIENEQIHPVLKAEYANQHHGELELFTTLSSFFKSKFPDIKLDEDIERNFLIADLATSRNFSQSHAIVGQLLHNLTFSDDQRRQILRNSLQNSQVSWLIKDSDVSELLKHVVEGHENAFSKEDLKAYKEAIS